VPWHRVGPGWALTEIWRGHGGEGHPLKAAPVSLDLVDPAGGRYVVRRWPATKNPPSLVDWSGDKGRALLSTGGRGFEQVALTTGGVSPFRVPGGVNVIGYTRPDGLNLLGWRKAGGQERLARYSLTGQLVRVLGLGAYDGSAMYSSSGVTLAVAGQTGVQLISNAGGVVRRLPVPGTSPEAGCYPARWWNSGTILATCVARGSGRNRLWLVPANGARPTALTPARGNHSPDFGDLNAWRLRSGLYLQSAGACGTVQIFRQAVGGSIQLVKVPHTAGNNQVVTGSASGLLIQAPDGCGTGDSLLWFNPASQHESWLFHSGVTGVVPFGEPAPEY
jgi:TolB protein